MLHLKLTGGSTVSQTLSFGSYEPLAVSTNFALLLDLYLTCTIRYFHFGVQNTRKSRCKLVNLAYAL